MVTIFFLEDFKMTNVPIKRYIRNSKLSNWRLCMQKKKKPKKTEQLILKKLSLNKEILSCKKKSDKVI